MTFPSEFSPPSILPRGIGLVGIGPSKICGSGIAGNDDVPFGAAADAAGAAGKSGNFAGGGALVPGPGTGSSSGADVGIGIGLGAPGGLRDSSAGGNIAGAGSVSVRRIGQLKNQRRFVLFSTGPTVGRNGVVSHPQSGLLGPVAGDLASARIGAIGVCGVTMSAGGSVGSGTACGTLALRRRGGHPHHVVGHGNRSAMCFEHRLRLPQPGFVG